MKENHKRLRITQNSTPGSIFFLLPVFAINLLIAVSRMIRQPSLLRGWGVILAFALVALAFRMRIYSLKVQDRVIRVEERLRLANLLPETWRNRIPNLTEGQLIALRFASDDEVPALVEKILIQNPKPAEIKKAIQVWRPDYWRV